MIINCRHSGMFRTYFEIECTRLDEFPALENDWNRLLHSLIKVGASHRYGDGEEDALHPMLENHVLTVFTDIAHKKLSNYGNSFANVQGTAIRAAYTQKLRQDINRWIARLDSYLHNTWQAGNNSSPAAETARWLKDRLEQSLSADELDGNNNYYRMLRTVTAIQENVDYYLNQIKDSGDMNCTPKVRHKTLGVFFMKYSYEQRLIIVSRVKQGEAIAHLSKEYHISETEILAWVRMWDHYGRSGLEQQSHCRPTVKLKEEVVRLILEKGVPLAHVRVEYRIGKTALQRWVSVVRKYGYGALEPSKRRGRPPKYPMGRPKKKEPQTELERLQAENLRLKAENALLKKAKALVEAKKAQALLNGHGPSTN